MNSILKPTTITRLLFFAIFDAILSALTLYAAFALRFNFKLPDYALADFWSAFAFLYLFKFTSFWIFGIYRVPWRFFGLKNLLKLAKAYFLAYAIFGAFFVAFHSFIGFLPRSVIVIDLALSILAIGSLRIAKRVWFDFQSAKEKPVIIVGANKKGELAARWLDASGEDYFPIAFFSNSPYAKGTIIHDLPVLNSKELVKFIKSKNIDSAILAEDYSSDELRKTYNYLHSIGISNVKKVSFLDEKDAKIEQIRIEDLLAREPKDLDKEVVKNSLVDKTILITGAGGSIGSEIARQCAFYGAKKIIAVDHSEYNLYSICDELQLFDIVPIMQSVCDKPKLLEVFNKFRPDIAIHAAAYKHVPLVEANMLAAIENNIIGTKNTIECAILSGVKKFTLISTDKAVRPTNVMGATKRVCELIVQNIKEAYPNSQTEVAAVRFGNVIGSSGSVVPKFRAQIESGGPITVTHPDIERYFMLISEACELTLQASAIANGGEIFILDMGERVKIVDLAKKMLELSGKTDDIEIVFSGLRPGEKLIEELLIDGAAEKTKYPSIFIACATNYDYELLLEQIEKLRISDNIATEIKNIVPEFEHKIN
ncbi:MAG: hypothetical protein RL154_1679 [Pseudomonadota bacterium]